MPVIRPADCTTHETHGSRFVSYLSPSKGSHELCAWRLTVPPGLIGVAHRPTHDEVLLVLDGELRTTLDGAVSELVGGDVLFVPANSELKVDGGSAGATAWVTTTPGLEAVTADGSRITPPWAQ